ncbi:MAG: UDP-N-acetylglucosamine 2-epimerase (non-hydrolyzing) [Treponema sp.]|nr:UDP-N-acetylglucosamine 2-epimerase (non-hydrolyzing) [Treponema sp.]
MNILTVIGARPQFVKAAVLSRYLRDNPNRGIKEILVHTGQHYDANMSDVFFKEMDIPQPDVNLHLGSGSHGKMTGAMLSGIEDLLIEKKPDALLVYGDTNSTLAGTLAASKLLIPVIHVEAGLRSFMMSMPEEQNRRVTDHLSTFLFCPTDTAVKNLRAEGIVDCGKDVRPSADQKCVCMAGDIMYEASLYYRAHNTVIIPDSDRGCILLTIHRQENTDDIQRLSSIVNAINELTEERFVFPVHPRTRKILFKNGLSFGSHVKLIDPIGYFEMLTYEQNCKCILTDSGGVQKEAFFFEKPCITMRDTTEWVELVENGWNTLTGADPKKIIHAVRNICKPVNVPLLYGAGDCAELIVNRLLK